MLYMCVYMFVCVCIKVLYIFNKYALLIGFVLVFSVSTCETGSLLSGHFSIFLLHFFPLELLFLIISLMTAMCKGIVTSLCLLENSV